MKTFQFIILLCSLVYGALSADNFFENDQRAELFKLTDYKMPTIKISMPDEEFTGLKDKATNFINFEQENFEKEALHILRVYLGYLKKINFYQTFNACDVDALLPYLNIGEDGYAKFDEEEVLAGFDLNSEHYLDANTSTIALAIANSNENFPIYTILMTIYMMRISEDANEEDKLNVYHFIQGYEHQTKVNILFFFYQFSEFKTKNATMTFELDGETQTFDKVTFSLGGQYSREFPKPGFNVKIKNNQDLYGRKTLKLRSDTIEPTFLRTKLVSDIHNRLGLKSLSANYAHLFINDEDMGLYILTDTIKLPWTEQVYGEKKSTNLYKCKNTYEWTPIYSDGCENENEDVTDLSELTAFFAAVEKAESASDLEAIFDIDTFLYEMAIEYLVAGWDHIQAGHNFFLYKQPNGKWIYLTTDYDLDMGAQNVETYKESFQTYFRPIHIIQILILNDPARFEKVIEDVVRQVFNPATLYPHIDALKQFLRPFVELDKTPDASGHYPGTINEKGTNLYMLDQWESNSEFTMIIGSRIFEGLKYWILMKYRNVCQNYSLECDPTFMSEDYAFSDGDSHQDIINGNLESVNLCELYPRITKEEPTNISTEDLTDLFTEIPLEEEVTLPPFVEVETDEPVEVEVTIPVEDDASSDEEDFSESETETSKTWITITKTKMMLATTTITN